MNGITFREVAIKYFGNKQFMVEHNRLHGTQLLKGRISPLDALIDEGKSATSSFCGNER